MNYNFDSRQAAEKAELEKKELIAETERKKQKIIFWVICGICLTIGIIAIMMFRSVRNAKKQQKLIEEQKQLVEEKQLAILDSMHYAERIQKSLLPTDRYIARNMERLKKKP
jgi:hypothetical protein